MKKLVKSSKSNLDSKKESQVENNPKSGSVSEKKVLEIDINLAEPHTSAMKVYVAKDLKGLKLTMNLVGQLETIKAVQRGEHFKIFDGISRFFAGRELGWKTIFIEVFDYSDEEIQERFVLHNFRPRRSYKELCRQSEVVLGILGLSQGKKRERIGALSVDDDNYGLVGKDRFEIACDIIGAGISASTLRRLLAVKEFEENGGADVKKFELMEKIEKGEMKIHQALNVIENYKKTKNEEGSNALVEAMRVIKGENYQLFNKSCEDLTDIPDESVDCITISSPYFQQRDYPDGVRDLGQPQHGMEKTVDEFVNKEVDIHRQSYRKLRKTGSLFMVLSDSYEGQESCLVIEKLCIGMKNSGWHLNQKIHWWKDNPKPQSVQAKRLQPCVEYLLHWVKDPEAFYYREFKIWKENGKYDVGRGSKDCGFGHKMKTHTWTLKKPLERFKNFLSVQYFEKVIHAHGFTWDELKEIDPSFRHLAPYPSVIPLLPILMSTKIGDTVLDIYNGTSTTTAVALQLGRRVIGYDTDTESHLFAKKRLELVEKNLPSINEVTDFENEFMINRSDQMNEDSDKEFRQAA